MKTNRWWMIVVAVGVLGGLWRWGGLTQAGMQDNPAASGTLDARDFPSLQAAIDALPPTGGIVRLPAGEFELTEPLVIRSSDVTLEGAGGATHLKNVNQEGQPALLLKGPQAENAKTPDKLWRIMLANFRITGQEKSGSGIEAHHVNEIFLQGLTVSYHGGNGILLEQCYEDPRINDCLITYNKQSGVLLNGCHDIVVNGNHFEENHDGLRCHDSFNLCMNGNNLDDHLGDGVVIENTYGSVLSGNMIEECQGWGIVLDRDCYGITLSANVIAHEFTGGIDLRDAHGCAVSANTFTLVKKEGLAIRAGSARITVTGNNFCDSYIGAAAKRTGKNTKLEVDQNEAAGIVLESTRDVAIVGNVFASLTTDALTVKGDTSRVLVTNNVLSQVSLGMFPSGAVAVQETNLQD